jgi:hypothetical protein
MMEGYGPVQLITDPNLEAQIRIWNTAFPTYLLEVLIGEDSGEGDLLSLPIFLSPHRWGFWWGWPAFLTYLLEVLIGEDPGEVDLLSLPIFLKSSLVRILVRVTCFPYLSSWSPHQGGSWWRWPAFLTYLLEVLISEDPGEDDLPSLLIFLKSSSVRSWWGWPAFTTYLLEVLIGEILVRVTCFLYQSSWSPHRWEFWWGWPGFLTYLLEVLIGEDPGEDDLLSLPIFLKSSSVRILVTVTCFPYLSSWSPHQWGSCWRWPAFLTYLLEVLISEDPGEGDGIFLKSSSVRILVRVTCFPLLEVLIGENSGDGDLLSLPIFLKSSSVRILVTVTCFPYLSSWSPHRWGFWWGWPAFLTYLLEVLIGEDSGEGDLLSLPIFLKFSSVRILVRVTCFPYLSSWCPHQWGFWWGWPAFLTYLLEVFIGEDSGDGDLLSLPIFLKSSSARFLVRVTCCPYISSWSPHRWGFWWGWPAFLTYLLEVLISEVLGEGDLLSLPIFLKSSSVRILVRMTCCPYLSSWSPHRWGFWWGWPAFLTYLLEVFISEDSGEGDLLGPLFLLLQAQLLTLNNPSLSRQKNGRPRFNKKIQNQGVLKLG